MAGLAVQVLSLVMLAAVPLSLLAVPYVMVTQALSGIAKDLTKMSSKSAVKLVVPDEGSLYRWVSMLTGSKNALKGVGFFLGGLLLTAVGFQAGLWILTVLVGGALAVVAGDDAGCISATPNPKAKFSQMFSNNRAVNVLAAARIFLFASRDVWFVIGVPVYLRSVLGWSFWQAGGFLAIWVIGYGARSGFSPSLRAPTRQRQASDPDGRMATWLAFALAAFPAGIAIALSAGADPTVIARRRPDHLRRDLRDELRRPQLPDPRLLRR